MLFDISNICTDVLQDDMLASNKISVAVLRLDKIHPLVSGNKLFKLHYFLEDALSSGHRNLITFGGAWSNHLVASAFACQLCGLKSIGIVRGERAAVLSATLQQCLQYGMQLKFISRESYAAKDDPSFIRGVQQEFGACTIVPEGGFHPTGAKGAALIMELIKGDAYSHVCTATGTATTLAGLLMAAHPDQRIIGVPILKGTPDIKVRIQSLSTGEVDMDQLQLLTGYHFGGYAKKTPALIAFMNHCWKQFQLPLDFVYTAKMFYALMDAVKNDLFPAGSSILCIHTGGLQGNDSLPPGTLLYGSS